jgi:diguanylate cyclase (GGDEF)-like protein
MHSIRIKIMAVTIAAIMTSILTLGGIGVLTMGLESDRSSAEKLMLISENIQQKLDAYLNSVQQSVSMAVRMADDSLNDPNIVYLGDSGTPDEVKKLDEGLSKHCAEVEHAFGSIAHRTNGIVAYYYCINSGYGSSEHGFFWSKLDNGNFLKKAPLISTELDPDDTEHTTWYYSPLKTGRPLWVGPYKAHFLGDVWTVSYVAPIYHKGFLLGVLGMDLLFDTMIEQLDEVKLYDTGFAFLMDRDGDVIYHPDMEVGGEPIRLSSDLSEKMLKRRSTDGELVRYNRNGQLWQLAFCTLSDDHKAAVTVPVSEITASQRQLMLLILLVAAVILAAFTIIILLIMNALTKPLLRLTSASQRLADGDYDVKLDYEGRDEVGILTRAFRQMRDHLKLYIKDLNAKAYTDAMTGVRNKGALEAHIGRLDAQIHGESQQEAPAFAIVICDCNRLKQINDQYGHAAGDTYLQRACRLICRVYDHSPVFRMGGDEFSVVLQHEDYENRDKLKRDFERMVQEQNAVANHPWEEVNVSMGMAVYDPQSDQSATQVLERADALMYEAKRQYRAS